MGRIGRTYPRVDVPKESSGPRLPSSTTPERPLLEKIAVTIIALPGAAALIAWVWKL